MTIGYLKLITLVTQKLLVSETFDLEEPEKLH